MKEFLGIDNTNSGLNDSRFVILPVPYEFSTSYGKGTAAGPEAIIEASGFVELYDDEFDVEPYLAGVYTAPPVTISENPANTMRNIRQSVEAFLNRDKFVVALGGEHSISNGVYQAFHQKFSNLSVLQFDAHTDLREEYEGSNFSHASVMKRIWDLNKDIHQVGIRAVSKEEIDFIREHKINTYFSTELHRNGFNDEIVKRLKQDVFITFDVDYFDPAIMPATGTPEPGGFLWQQTIDFLTKVFLQKNVVGCDVVELSPETNLKHCDFLSAKLVHKMMAMKLRLANN